MIMIMIIDIYLYDTGIYDTKIPMNKWYGSLYSLCKVYNNYQLIQINMNTNILFIVKDKTRQDKGKMARKMETINNVAIFKQGNYKGDI